MHKENLLRLATYLETLPADYSKFAMETFQRRESRNGNFGQEPFTAQDVAEVNLCGTAGCAIGHAPLAGFPVELSDKGWFPYSERISGLKNSSEEWEWCFGGDWEEYDNTPKGAAARIRRLVETGTIGELPWRDEEGDE